MDIFKRNITLSSKLLKAHFILHFISYGFSALNYALIFCYKKKYFIMIFFAVQTLLLIFITHMIFLLKSSFLSEIVQIQCVLITYAIAFIIFVIFVIIQYILIFKLYNSLNVPKIVLSCIGLLYYILDGIIFVHEYCIISKQIKIAKENSIKMQTTAGTNVEKNCKNETMDSDKSKKIENEKFEKDDTTYIIHANNNPENYKNNNSNNKNKKIGLCENKSTISYYGGRNKKIEKKKKIKSNIDKDDFDSNRIIKLNEGNKSFILDNIKINISIFK